MDQIITPMLGPDNTVTPERANLDQQENMIRKRRREVKTETKRDRKSIIAENPKTHKTLQKQWFETVISHPSAGTSKTVNFGKGGDKLWFLGPRQNTLRF